MMPLTERGKTLGWTLALGVVLGLFGGWVLWRPRAVPVEAAAPAVRQKDSSLVLARRPDTVIKIKQVIPKGWVPERAIEVAVQPTPRIDTVFTPGHEVLRVDTLRAPVVRVSLTSSRLPDGTHRVTASSPDGGVLDSLSIDVPLGPAKAPPRVLAWSAGVTRDLLTGTWGAVVSRDVAFGRLYAQGEPAQGLAKAQLKVGVGLRF